MAEEQWDFSGIPKAEPAGGWNFDGIPKIDPGWSASPVISALLPNPGGQPPKPPSPTAFEPQTPKPAGPSQLAPALAGEGIILDETTGQAKGALYDPIGGARQVAQGAKAFAAQIPANVKRGLDLASTEPFISDDTKKAASDMIEGTFEVAKPAMLAAFASNPVVAGTAVGVSAAAAKAAHAAATAAGASPETARLAANIAAVGVTGVATSKILDVARTGALKVAADARAVAEQVRAFDAANPPPAAPEPVNVGRGATEAVRAAREPVAEPVAPVSPEPVAPVVASETALDVFSPDEIKILKKQGFNDATIAKMIEAAKGGQQSVPYGVKTVAPTTPVAAEPQIAPAVVEEPEIAPTQPYAPGDTVKIIGEGDTVHEIESVGPDGWIYTRSGAAVKPEQVERAAPVPVQSGGFDYDRQPPRPAARLGAQYEESLLRGDVDPNSPEGRARELLSQPVDVSPEARARYERETTPQAAVNPSGNADLTTSQPVAENGPNEASNLSGEPLSPAASPARADVDEGTLAARRESERPAPESSGLQPSGRDQGRAPLNRPVRGSESEPVADTDVLNDLIGRAVAGGYRGNTGDLRAELTDRLQLIRSLDAEFEDSGRNPETLLRAIAKGGGISESAETGQKGEIARLKEFRDQQASQRITTSKTGERKASGRPGALITMDSIRGVRGVFRKSGMTLDGTLEYLRQDPRFSHIETIEDLTSEIERAATAKPDMEAAKALRKGLGEKWWENVTPRTEDVLDTGEIQPRLPEAGTVRDQNIATPEFEVPFSLEAEIDRTARERPEDLFGGIEPGDDEGPDIGSERGAVQVGALVPRPVVSGLERVGRVAHEIKATVSPSSMSAEAQRAADVMRHARAATANAGTMESLKGKPLTGVGPTKGAERLFERRGYDAGIADISAYERTGKYPDIKGLSPEYSDYYQQSEDLTRKMLRYAYGQNTVGHIENHVTRLFRFKDRVSQQKGEAFVQANARRLSADRGPTRRRVLLMPLDEAVADMKARGIDVELATSNPETLRQWGLVNATLAVHMKNAWTVLRDDDNVTWVPHTETHKPIGMVKINERGAKWFYPAEMGQGDYYADENVARVLNNAAEALGTNSPTVQAILTLSNTLNQFQLSLSGFHATASTISAQAADGVLALQRVFTGRPMQAIAPTLRSLVPGVSAVWNVWKGQQFINALKDDNPEAWRVLRERINPAGVRLQMDARYRTDALAKLKESWRAGELLESGGRLILAAVELAAKPLMSYAVPRIKLAVALEHLADIQQRMPNATPEQLHRAYAAAADQIDNVFGLMVYDNGFWKASHRNILHAMVRSVGWTGGTQRWAIGAVADFAKVPKGMLHRNAQVTDRMAWSLVAPVILGYLGAMYMYLHTRKLPSSTKDIYYPENGGTDEHGRPSRTRLPWYSNDFYGYTHDPKNTLLQKQSPGLEMAWEVLAKNEDYYGTLIRDPNDPATRQAEDLGKYVVKSVLPFSFTQISRVSKERGGSLEAQTEAWFGLTPASAAVSRTPLETYMHDLVPPAHLTHEQAKSAQARRDVRALAQGGHLAEAHTAGRAAGLSEKSIQAVFRTAREGVQKEQFGRLSWAQAVKGYILAEPDERKPLWSAIQRKVDTAMRAAPDRAARQTVLEQYRDLRKLPTAAAQPRYMAPSLMPNATQGATAP